MESMAAVAIIRFLGFRFGAGERRRRTATGADVDVLAVLFC